MKRKLGIGIGIVAALALCLGLFLLPIIQRHNQEKVVRDHFICLYPPFQAVRSGMSQSQVSRLLGQPSSTKIINPQAVTWTPVQLKKLYDEDTSLMAALGTWPNTGLGNPVLQKKYNRLMIVRDLEETRVREAWYYPVIPSWHGGIEIYFDARARVAGKNCGNG